jgi:hypothetical protein
MELKIGQPISQQLRDLVNMELDKETINKIGRESNIYNASLIFEGIINVSKRNTDFIINVVNEAIKCRTLRFPKDV